MVSRDFVNSCVVSLQNEHQYSYHGCPTNALYEKGSFPGRGTAQLLERCDDWLLRARSVPELLMGGSRTLGHFRFKPRDSLPRHLLLDATSLLPFPQRPKYDSVRSS